MRSRLSSLLPAIGLMFAMLIWGSSYVAMKVALQAYDPSVILFARMAIASVLFLFGWRSLNFPSFRHDWKWLLALGFCEPCLYLTCEAHALVYTTSSQAGIITALLPLFVTIAAHVFFRERIAMRMLMGFLIALGGIAVLSIHTGASQHAPNPLRGNMLQLFAMCWATGYTMLVKYLGARYSAVALSAFQMFMGTLFFAPTLLLPSTRLPALFPAIPTLAVLYLGGCVTVLAYSFYNHALRHISATQASAAINLIPVFALLFGWLLLDERLSHWQWYGIGLVVIGIALSSFNSPQNMRRVMKGTTSHEVTPGV